jgi:type IV fimbrial biogenesis protein FimT
MNRSKGFTTVELMVVVGIAGVLAMTSTLSYLTLRTNLHLSGASRQILGDLLSARMKAVNQNKIFKVFFPSGTNQYKICDDADGNGTVEDGEGDVLVKNIQDDYPGVTIAASVDPVFSPRGTATAGATVTLTNTKGSKTVSVASTGRVKING